MRDELNEEQRRVVCFGTGPLLVLAGAGSGKTRVLIHRVLELINKAGVNPDKIVLLTFTNKAAEEMKRRVVAMGAKRINLGFAGTFHTFGVRILREFGEKIGINNNFTIFDSDDSEKVMKLAVEEMGWDLKENKPSMYLGVIGKMKNDLVSRADLAKTTNNYFLKRVIEVWTKYEEKMKKNNALDFDDLLIKTVEALRINEVRKIINTRFEWILVDEYQDTNKAQFEITKNLAQKSQNITAVGDASQAIYSFRGADFRNLLLLQTEFPTLTTVSLPKNYRSTQHILDSAYGVIKNNTGHPTIKLESTQREGERIELIETVDERDEARKIIAETKKKIDKGAEVAILYRTNAQSRSFEDELVRCDTPYRLVGGTRFYGRAEIKDLIAYLRVVNNPEEEVSRKRLEGMGKRRLALFDIWREKQTRDLKKENPGELLQEIIEATKYLDRFDEREESDVERIENINELLAVAGQTENVSVFLESTALAESEIKQSKSEAKVTLMTVHAAKGLEFDNVFLVGLEEGLFPHTRSIQSGNRDEIEEERRLMYVAMTRAKENLIISWSRSRTIYGGKKQSIPSRFLAEIPEGSINTIRDNEEGLVKKRRIVQDWEEIDNW